MLWQDVKDVLKGILSNVIVIALLALGFFHSLVRFLVKNHVIELKVNVVALIAGTFFFAIAIVYGAVTRSQVRVYRGRSRAMAANVRLLGSARPKKGMDAAVLSTRVTEWSLLDHSQQRSAFRSELNRCIQDGILVRRIWQIRTRDDLDLLCKYVSRFGMLPNYAVRCIVGRAPLPELLVVNGRWASLAFPQRTSVTRLDVGFHLMRRHDVLAVEGYFEAMWVSALPIAEGGRVDDGALQRLIARFSK